MATADDLHRDIEKEFENFLEKRQTRTSKNTLIQNVTTKIRTMPVDQSLKDIDNNYTEMFGPDVAEYARSARTSYLNDIYNRIRELVPQPIEPPPQGGKRKTRRRRYSRRR